MIYPNGRGHNQWGRDASVPDISRIETKLWFYTLAVSYLDAGIEALHFGQAEIMNANDPDSEHWWQLLRLVRSYAAQHSRRHLVLCDAHVPSGGLPYLVEVDNWGASDRPGQPHVGGCWVWGYDEISWFAHQSQDYRNRWLRYAWNWVREHDPNGFLQMPGSRCLHSPVDGQWWYFANMPSAAVPDGFGQEDTIREIWAAPAGDSLPLAP